MGEGPPSAGQAAPRRSVAARAWLLLVGAWLTACHHAPPPVVPLQGRFHTVQPGETLAQVAARYHVPLEDLLELNALPDDATLVAGSELFIPEGARRPTAGSAASRLGVREVTLGGGRGGEGTAPLPVAGRLEWPVIAPLSSPFGWRDGRPHDGIDLAVPDGTPVRAADDGAVAFAGDRLRGYGRLVILEHAGGLVTVYAHNEALLVAEGERVARGQVIARSGHTGRVTAPHLHFEVRAGGRAVDPLPWLGAR